MSRQLVLLRHAHADPQRAGLADFDRTLSERGHSQMQVVAPAVADAVALEQVICSAALRTLETARALCLAAGLDDATLISDPGLYEVPASAIWTRIRQIDPPVERVALVLHNPGVSDLTRELIAAPIRGFEPADFALIEINCDWSEIRPGSGKLIAG